MFPYDGLWWEWPFILEDVDKGNWELIVGVGIGIKMPWVERNRGIRGGSDDYSELESK